MKHVIAKNQRIAVSYDVSNQYVIAVHVKQLEVGTTKKT